MKEKKRERHTHTERERERERDYTKGRTSREMIKHKEF
jgi:hypothetical protein